MISHLVKPRDEAKFKAFQERITAVARGSPGFRADELLKPVPGIQDEWTVLYRLDTAEHADAWLGAAISIAFLTLAAAVFWLLTTQVWTLP